MVLVDTSVWIRFLANRAPFAAALEKLLARDEAAGHELIYGELLVGDHGGRKDLLTGYQIIQQAQTIPHGEVVLFVRERDLTGRGMGWIDVHLLASAIVGGMQLWTADQRLATVAEELKIAYQPFAA
jgi:predicted nucleic acid-binding protein